MSNISLTAFSNPYNILWLENSDKHMRAIEPQLTADFGITTKEIFLNSQQKLEAQLSSVSQLNVLSYYNLMKLKESYIFARNEIIDSFFKYFIPKYRRRLREIDLRLDELDLQIYMFERENSVKETELREIIHLAEEKLEKYSHHLSELYLKR